MKRRAISCAFSILLAMSCAELGWAEPATPLPWSGEESVSVQLLTVPFFAVDAHGKAVTDLRADEVELEVGGKRLTPDTFDARVHGATTESFAKPGAPVAESLRSQLVVVFLDRAFLNPGGWHSSQRAATEVVDGLPPSDRVMLLVNDPQKGLEVLMGAQPADQVTKARFRALVMGILPSVGRLQPRAEAGLPPSVPVGRKRWGVPGTQLKNYKEGIGVMARAEYRSVANDMAEDLQLMAVLLSHTPGSKLLLLFSGGIDSELFFNGEVPFKGSGSKGSAESFNVDVRRAEPMMQHFQHSYASLAAAGVNLVTVNPEPIQMSGRIQRSGREMIAQLSRAVGGILVESTNPEVLRDQIRETTTAEYVAGVYSESVPSGVTAGEVKVVVKRPGVTAFAPRRLPSRKRYRALDAAERKLLVVTLVQEGGQGAPVLPGKVASAATSEAGRRLRFEAQRPAAVDDRPLDLYDVVLHAGQGQEGLQLASYQESLHLAPRQPLRAETTVVSGQYVWGILVVEPESGAMYLRRLQLQAPSAHASR